MKKVLIISPYFPPCNAADMQRVRMSLPYFASCGWEAEVVVVDPIYADIATDELLTQTIPAGIKIHRVKALNKKWTGKLGLGSIALRSLWYYRKKVNQLLKTGKYDLVYFSTTQFPVCVLGAYWKKKFNIPYVIDMQDPWHSAYYDDKPAEQKPPKYWFAYRLNKYLEPIALKNVDGIISVSEKYIAGLKQRYPGIAPVPAATIPFGAFEPDMAIANQHQPDFENLLDDGCINIVYIGRGGMDMYKSISPVFETFKACLTTNESSFAKIRFYFIGTSYAGAAGGTATVIPLAKKYGIENYVVEHTGRISYYHTLSTLQRADALFIPGSDDPSYTASKIFPYLLTLKPILAVFNEASSAIKIMQQYGALYVYAYQHITHHEIEAFFSGLISGDVKHGEYATEAINKYSAGNMTVQQCKLFDQVIKIR